MNKSRFLPVLLSIVASLLLTSVTKTIAATAYFTPTDSLSTLAAFGQASPTVANATVKNIGPFVWTAGACSPNGVTIIAATGISSSVGCWIASSVQTPSLVAVTSLTIGTGSQSLTMTTNVTHSVDMDGEIRAIPNANGSLNPGGLFGCNQRDGLPTAGRCLATDRLGDTNNRLMFDVDGTFNWGPGNTGSTVSLAYGGLNATTGAGKMVLSGEFALNRFLTINASQPTVLIPGAATGLKISAPAAIPYQLLLESASNTSQLIMGANTSGFGASILAVRTDSPFTTPLFLQPNGSALVIGTSTYDAAGAPVQITPITQFKAVGASVLFDTGGYISPTNSGLGTIEIRDGANLQLILSKTATTRFGNLGVNSNNQMQVSCFRSDAPYVCDTSINPDGGSLFVGSGTTCSVKMCLNGALKVSSATMIASATSFTNGAAAAAGTLLNAPVAGNPTKWIPVDDNGTTRYIPTW